MLTQVKFLRAGVVLIDIMTGKPTEINQGATHELLPTKAGGKRYYTLKGEMLGALQGRWESLEKDGFVSLTRSTNYSENGITFPVKSRAELTEDQINNTPIGYFIKGQFVCPKCSRSKAQDNPKPVAVYPCNILPYSQDCWECGVILFEVARCRGGALAILFEKPKND